MPGGFFGKMLEVDLTEKKTRLVDTNLEDAEKFAGGRGLGAKMLWDRVKKPGLDPWSADNPLMFVNGPLDGAPIPASRITVCTKSPHTAPLKPSTEYASTLSWSCMGGMFGPETKWAGYDAIIFTGRADKPVYVVIKDDRVEIKDASHLWGKTCSQTDDLLRNELGPQFRTCYIGPAGENLVEYAAIITEGSRAAGRTGVGAVMGSKKLKAIAVRGTKMLPINDKAEFEKTRAGIMQSLNNWTAFEQWKKWGTCAMLNNSSDNGTLVTKNYREGTYEFVDLIGATAAEKGFWVKHRSCYHCPIRCMKMGVVPSGPYAGTVAEGPEYETGTMHGSNCLVKDFGGLMKSITTADDYGLDSISTGNVMGFLMECYEKGIVTKKDLDGIEMTWGNVPAMLAIQKKIAYRQGIGDLLSQGVRKIAKKFGNGAEKIAIHVKGNELAAWNIHANHGFAIVYGTSNRGGCHQVGATIKDQHFRTMCDSLVMCRFVYYGIGAKDMLANLNAITGWNWSEADYLKAAERIWNLEKCFNVLEGFRREDDYVPTRFHTEPLTYGPKKGAYLAMDKQEQILNDYYKERGWDPKTSIPTKERLKDLGLEFAIAELEKAKVF